MLKQRISALLNVRPDETHMVVLIAGLFLALQAGQGIGENAAFALFLSKINVDFLPYMYMGLGGAVFLASIAYSASLSRYKNSNVVRNLLAGSAVLFAVEWIIILVFGNALSYPVLWLTTFGMSVVLGTLLWTVAGEVCDAWQAKRLFPLFTSMGILGSVFGNLLTGLIARVAGTNNLIFLYALLLGLGFFLARVITDRFFKPAQVTNLKFNLLRDVRDGYQFMRETQLFRLIAISSILYSILFFTVDFPFSERISNAYLNDAAGLAGFKGLFTSITTAVTFLISLLLANRLYTRLGVVNSVLIMPLTYMVAFILFFVSFNFWGAVSAKFGQMVILGGVAGTAWNALFNVVPRERRGQVLAFNDGVPSQIGVILSGLLIILSKQVLSTQNILLLGALLAVVVTFLTFKMRSAYGEALLDALRAGRVEVFSEEEGSFTGYKDEAAALQVTLKALHDSKASTRRLAAEMVGRMNSLLAVPDLLERISDEDAGVRAAAIRALADLDARRIAKSIVPALDDTDDTVRATALASLLKLEVFSSPELIQRLERMSQHQSLDIAAGAAVLLLSLGESPSAWSLLKGFLKNTDVNKRHAALEALGRLVESTQGREPFEVELLTGVLNDPAPMIRRDAIHVLSLRREWSISEPVYACLSDADVTVRRIASEALKQVWPESRTKVIQLLEARNVRTSDAALDAIPSGDPEMLSPLRAYIQREVSNIGDLLVRMSVLPKAGPALALLMQTLQYRETLSEERLIKAIGLFGNPRALELIRKSLNAGDVSRRAAALEALETLGDKTITQEVLPILDRGLLQTPAGQKLNVSQVIDALLSNEDYWLRALAAGSIPELGLQGLTARLGELKSDPAELVRQAAAEALERLKDGAEMKTLKTISTLERILLLREVPMFSRLSPEDLEQVAEIAEEQLYADQTFICREGEPGNTLFIIVNGKVKVMKEVNGAETLLATRTDGEFVGEMAILESAPRSATLQADGDVRVLAIAGKAFTTILLDRPEVAVSVLQYMSTRVRDLMEKMSVPVRS